MDAPAQLSVLSYLKSPRAQLQPALLLAPKFPRDSALAQHCSLDCPEIPQGCSSKTTTAFSHRHGGIFFILIFFFSYVRAVGTSLHESGLWRCGVRLSRDRELVRRFSLCKWWSKPYLFLAPASFFFSFFAHSVDTPSYIATTSIKEKKKKFKTCRRQWYHQAL